MTEQILQINQIAEAGADIVRVSCPDEESTKALKEIVKHANVPIVADIHFHYKRAIEAAEAGVSCLRINPGIFIFSLKLLYAPEICGANSVKGTSIESFTLVGESFSTALFN